MYIPIHPHPLYGWDGSPWRTSWWWRVPVLAVVALCWFVVVLAVVLDGLPVWFFALFSVFIAAFSIQFLRIRRWSGSARAVLAFMILGLATIGGFVGMLDPYWAIELSHWRGNEPIDATPGTVRLASVGFLAIGIGGIVTMFFATRIFGQDSMFINKNDDNASDSNARGGNRS